MKKTFFLILPVAFCCLVVSCGRNGQSVESKTSVSNTQSSSAAASSSFSSSSKAEVSHSSSSEASSIKANEEPVFQKRELSYDKSTLPLINEMISVFEKKGTKGVSEIDGLLSELKAKDHDIGELWKKVMDHWEYVSSDLLVNQGELPSGLPKDDSLCLLVPGFQLNEDGSMQPELIERLKLSLRCALQYPKARLLLSGGPTSVFYGENAGKVGSAEADVMAEWLISNGVEAERIMRENKSMTTSENAMLSADIIKNATPKIRYLAIISSDYHIPTVSLLFYAQAERMYYETGERPFEIISNAGCFIEDRIENLTVFVQSEFLKEVMGVP
ncbi:MAG: YdcF family protein [Lachnospiraceae bacterium]|nr:YdcF family protein [Lachnospiraceae bacterium]